MNNTDLQKNTSNEVSFFSELSEIIPLLSTFSPETLSDSAKCLKLISILNRPDVLNRIKKESYEIIEKLYPDDDWIIDPETDIGLVKVVRQNPVYNITEEMKNIQEKINALKKEYSDLQKNAEISHYNSTVYYKIKS